MKKNLFIFLALSYALFADALPQSINTTVSDITSTGEIQLSSSIPKGMSGIIIHNYGNGLSAITHTSISKGAGKASVANYTAILHENIPTVQTAVSIGDKVIFGDFYNNVLLIAPNQTAYQQIKKRFNRTWIHPDAYALDFMKEGETSLSTNSLRKFAKKNQIGLILIVTSNKLLVLDPISKQFIAETALVTNPNSALTPFYARFEQIDTSTFGFDEKNYTSYFKSVAGLK